jgi:hypothetical protein
VACRQQGQLLVCAGAGAEIIGADHYSCRSEPDGICEDGTKPAFIGGVQHMDVEA